jgi:hypothetical protein
MDVVGTVTFQISSVHDHHISSTTCHSRVTGLAGIPGIVGVPPVTCPAADPFMYTHRGAVIFGPSLVSPVGRVALNTNALQGVVGNQDRLFSLVDVWFPEHIGTEVHPVGTKVETGICISLLPFIEYGVWIVH